MVASTSVRRVFEVEDTVLAGVRFDYADCFEVTVSEPDTRTVESLARAALEGMPFPLRWVVLAAHRFALRFRLGPLTSAEHVLGWKIVSSTPEDLVLEAAGPIMRALMVARKTGYQVTVIKTFVFYRHPAARFIWAIVGPVHRTVAPYLLRRAAGAG